MQKAMFFLTILNVIYLFATMFIDNDANILTVTLVAPPFFAFLLLVISTVGIFFTKKESKLTKYVFIINGFILLSGFILIRL